MKRAAVIGARTAFAVLLLVPVLASAALRDHGTVDVVTGFPTWYRDNTGAPLEPCLAQTASPNPAAGGAPMCFPVVPNPAGFPGNFGDEAFYQAATAQMTTLGGFAATLDLALELAFANGTPIHGDEMVFGRVRLRIDAPVAGTYTVTHPFGVEVFPDVQPGTRSINFTQDIGAAAGQFDQALSSRIGPFLRWDALFPGESLTILNADGTVKEEYLGDPNYAHTITGSPFDTNYFRVDGPPGSNLDGAGNDFIQTSVFAVLGKKYLTPIPAMLAFDRVTYARDAAGAQIDVFATSEPGAQLVVSGTGMTPANMRGDGTGHYFAHVDFPAGAALPGAVVLTNTGDVPPSSKSTGVTDLVVVNSAIYDASTGLLSVTAATSDHAAVPPVLTALTTLGAAALAPGADPWVGSLTTHIDSGVPPLAITVISSAGGYDTAPVAIVASAPRQISPPVAFDDAVTTNQNVAALIAAAANDVLVPPATFARLRLMTAPAHGTAQVSAADPKAFSYVPAKNYFGADSFTYVLEDSTGALSNIATVSVTVNRTAIAPIAMDDSANTRVGVTIRIPVLDNDSAANGTLDPASVTIGTLPKLGNVTRNPDGSLNYNPRLQTGTDTFTYTVRDSFGVVSNAATVTVIVLSGADILTVSRVEYIVSKKRWRISGSSNVFGPGLNNKVRIHNGPTATAPVIGIVPIDALGAFTFDTTTAPPPDATQLVTLDSSGGGVLTTRVAFK
jgi:hypothetical protein